MIVRTLSVCVFLQIFSVGATFAQNSPYRNLASILADYFASTAYLPVLPLHQDELPGDIYSSVNNFRPTFLTRQDACFSGASINAVSSHAIEVGHFSEWELEGGIDLPVQKIVEVSLEGRRNSVERMHLSLADTEVISITDAELLPRLLNPSGECLDAMLTFGLLDGEFSGAVPGILQEVIYGRPRITIHVNRDVRLRGAAEIEASIEAIPEVSLQAGSTLASETDFSFTSVDPIPVAWRPAFISKTDVERLQELEENGVFLRLQRWVGLRGLREEERDEIRNSFYDIVPSPDELFREMTVPPSEKFDPSNPVHLRYLQKKGQLFAISFELYFG